MRLIDADALYEKVDESQAHNNHQGIAHSVHNAEHAHFKFMIHQAPTIEAEPVRHGRWIFGSSKTSCWMTCSICCKSQSGQTATFSYCPNCGARMDADHIADASKKVGGADNG